MRMDHEEPIGKSKNLSIFCPLRYALCSMPFAVVTGYPFARHPFNPPSRGRTRETPFFFNCSAARALDASLGQLQ